MEGSFIGGGNIAKNRKESFTRYVVLCGFTQWNGRRGSIYPADLTLLKFYFNRQHNNEERQNMY